jgi:hypothetical protein
MTKRKNVKAMFIEVPIREYQIFKTFALQQDVSLQKFIRSAAIFWIKEAQKNVINSKDCTCDTKKKLKERK